MPNQNPNAVDGANPMGRWDYGPFFWPPWPTTNKPLTIVARHDHQRRQRLHECPARHHHAGPGRYHGHRRTATATIDPVTVL